MPPPALRHSFVLPVTTEILYALPLDDPFASVKYERCAVVGNSGILGLYKLGEHIDQHDMVIRFNLAPTEGYGEIVGRKTTFRLVNSQHVGFHEANETVIQQMQSEVGVQLFLKARADHPERKCVLVLLSLSLTSLSSDIHIHIQYWRARRRRFEDVQNIRHRADIASVFTAEARTYRVRVRITCVQTYQCYLPVGGLASVPA